MLKPAMLFGASDVLLELHESHFWRDVRGKTELKVGERGFAATSGGDREASAAGEESQALFAKLFVGSTDGWYMRAGSGFALRVRVLDDEFADPIAKLWRQVVEA